jgi:hypothetical protein
MLQVFLFLETSENAMFDPTRRGDITNWAIQQSFLGSDLYYFTISAQVDQDFSSDNYFILI